jgi:hypothetical protein
MMALQARRTAWSLVFVGLMAFCAVVCSANARAVVPGPGWEVSAHTYPTNLAPGSTGYVSIDVYNVGAEISGAGAVLTDTLPTGVTATGGAGCSGTTVVTCEVPAVGPAASEVVTIPVSVIPSASGTAANHIVLSGGGASGAASVSDPIVISSTSPGFGLAGFDGWFTNADGTPDKQAGSHPYEMTVELVMNNKLNKFGWAEHVGEAKDFTVAIPPGLVGNPSAVPLCTRQQLDGIGGGEGECPADSQVGIDTATLGEAYEGHPFRFRFPVYNMMPPAGVPAQFAFEIFGSQVFFDAGVRTGGDYGITEHVDNVPERTIAANSLTLWGVPGESSHDSERYSVPSCYSGCASGAGLKPLLTLPSSCAGPQRVSVEAVAWQSEALKSVASFESHDGNGVPYGLGGCERLPFAPSLGVVPDSGVAGAPSGLSVDLRVPAHEETPGGLANGDVRGVTVALPAGMTVSPSVAGGLEACTQEEIGLADGSVPSCPAASRVGSVEVVSPVLERPLIGSVFVAQQGANPFGSLLALYVVAEGDGVLIKAAGEVRLDPVTGQVTAAFSNLPEDPVSDIKLHMDGGSRAPLVNPDACGPYTASGQVASSGGGVPVELSSGFEINEGCHAGLFGPSFVAGTLNNQAGAFSPFSVLLSRQDGEQVFGGVRVTTPPGLLGILRGVERCGEPQASLGTCGEGSLIGHTTVAAGVGPDPVSVTGQVFLTGPYKGAPYGLSILVPAVAGPFNLGNVVVRAAVSVDPRTAQITVSSDPLPTILQGIPLQVKTVNVSIDRQGFMFNPTDCEPLAVTGVLSSTRGATAGVSSHFQAANCAALAFHPVFTVSSQAKTSKKNGASLTVTTTYLAGAQANIRSVAVTLPKQLPARLTTIQQACPETVFNANPAGCPAGSAIGTGTARTPVLASPVSGPAYLVSHGGAAFPDLVVVLQGENVTLNLVGSIDIKHGVTSSTFASVPDAPISSFQLSLPEGPHSGLAAVVPAKAKGSLCGQSLSMPFTITAQNGAVLKETPKITVTGCPKAKKKKNRAKPTHRARAKKQGKKGK